MRFKPANDHKSTGLDVEVAAHLDIPGAWVVEAVDNGSEGEVYSALFAGPKAEERAHAYADFAFGAH